MSNNRLPSIAIVNQSKQSIGGGFTFIENFKKGVKNFANVVSDWKTADFVLIAGITQVEKDLVEEIYDAKKKIIVRIDNIPKNSRNRGRSINNMMSFVRKAWKIIFQSKWADQYAGSWLRRRKVLTTQPTKVIYNGVDTEIFNCNFDELNKNPTREFTYIFVSANKDPCKNFHEAAYFFHQVTADYYNRKEMNKLKHNEVKPTLIIVGNFSDDLTKNRFDFFDDEQFEFYPMLSCRRSLAKLYRRAKWLYHPAFGDACPNVVSEAMACGCQCIHFAPIGGTAELIKFLESRAFKPWSIQDMAKEYVEFILS